jgi:hypothetical protein
MRIPFLILSYGSFAKTKKLFSYEKEGVHILPIFTSADVAYRFIKAMHRVLKKLKDPRRLQTQICDDPKMALAMFETVSVYCPDLRQIVIDPDESSQDEDCFNMAAQIQIVENSMDIDEVLDELRELVDSGSNTP